LAAVDEDDPAFFEDHVDGAIVTASCRSETFEFSDHNVDQPPFLNYQPAPAPALLGVVPTDFLLNEHNFEREVG
jgi:hypothetical protein